jgi:hypothetical protein
MAAKKEPTLLPTQTSAAEFLDAIGDPKRRADAEQVRALMQEVTGEGAVVWGGGILGFGRYHYRYASGHEGDAPLAAFAPRKQHLVVYLAPGFAQRHATTLAQLGPYKAGKGCLYLKTLAELDQAALRHLIHSSAQERLDAGH